MTQKTSFRCFLIVMLLMLAAERNIRAQCVVFKVIVDGEVHSELNNTKVLVRVHANKGKKTSESVAVPEANRFHIEVGFDTFISVHFFGSHNCSRRPTDVDVILLVKESPKQTVRLSLERDFARDEKIPEWHTKKPVVLSGGKATPWHGEIGTTIYHDGDAIIAELDASGNQAARYSQGTYVDEWR